MHCFGGHIYVALLFPCARAVMQPADRLIERGWLAKLVSSCKRDGIFVASEYGLFVARDVFCEPQYYISRLSSRPAMLDLQKGMNYSGYSFIGMHFKLVDWVYILHG
jgi:hypothetical protein